VASLSQGRTAAAQCGLFTYKSVPVIFEPPCIYNFYIMAQQPLVGQSPLTIEASRSHTDTHTTLGRTAPDEWPARRRGLYRQHTTHKRQTSMSLAGLEPTIPESLLQHTHVLDRQATGTGTSVYTTVNDWWALKYFW